MATFTITAANTNIDSLTSKAGDDTYNVNGGELIIDNDTRYGQNQTTSARLGTITNSATLGGSTLIRSNKIRMIYFTGGSGTVPAYNTTISQGSASGLLIGVHSALNAAPTTPGSAMPASGYIRIKQWNDVAFTSGALTGITATCAADPVFGTYDRVGWMIVVGNDSKRINYNRLNNISDDPVVGAKLLVGITDGTRTTGYQIPNNGEALYFAGVEVETSAGSGEYEWWPTTTSPMTSYHLRTTGEASKQCYLDAANAIIYFGYDGTNSSGGQCPGAGRNIRIPNCFLQSCTTAAPTVNAFSAIGSRYFMYADGAGRWRINDCSMAWRANIVSNAYEVSVVDSSICQTLTISTNATPFELDNVCISNPTTDAVNNNGLVASNSIVGGTADGCVFSVGYSNNVNKASLSLTSSSNITFTDCKFLHAGMPSSTANAVSSSIAADISFQNCYFVGKHTHSQSENITAQNCTSGGVTSGDPIETASSVAYFSLSNKCSGFLFEDWTFTESEQLGKGAFITLTGSSNNNKFRRMGTYASPIMARGAVNYDASWSRSGSTITVTLTSHGFRTNDLINVLYGTASSTHSTGQKTITVTGANTFTYTGNASGDTSGTLTFYRTFCSTTVDVGSGCENNEFQQLFVEGAYSRSVATVNTCFNTVALNIGAGLSTTAIYGGIDMTIRGVSNNSGIPSTTSAQYGHTFADGAVLASTSATGGTGDSWSRTSSTITVTHTDHGLDTNNTRIRIYDPSDATATAASTPWKYATVLTKDTFSFSGSASGSASGTISWEAPTDKLQLYMNEESESVSRYTVDSGTPSFTGAGALSATTVGDQITWEMPEYLINYTGFANIPIETTLAETVASQGAFRFTYDIAKDDGAFSGTFKNLSLILTATGGTSGAATMTFADTTNIAAGDRVTGLGVPNDAYVSTVDSSTQITLSSNLLANASGDYMFNQLPAETFTTNFKLKVRQTTLTANALSNSYINIPLTSDATSRAETYPVVAVTVNITVTGIASGYRIQVYNVTQATEIDNSVTTGTSYTYVVTNEADDGDIIRIRLAKADKYELQQSGVFSSTSGLTILAEPETDDVWTAYGVDGSALTAYAWDSANEEIEINESGTTWSAKDLYAWYKYYITTATGVDEVFGLIEAKDVGNIELGAVKLDNLDSNSLAPEDEIRVYRSDEAWIVRNPTTGGGDLGVYSTGTIYVKNINTATNVITGDIADIPTVSEIADGVWDEALSGHTTAGTAGKIVIDTESNSDVTQAKVDQL